MVGLAAPFSQVSGHLLPSQAGDLNPLPVDQGLTSRIEPAEVSRQVRLTAMTQRN
jgi:hypothetical protein